MATSDALGKARKTWLQNGSWLEGDLKIHPEKLTWNLKITQLKRKIIFQTLNLHFWVPAIDFPGCISSSRLVAPHFHHFWSKSVPLISLEITLCLLALRSAIWSLTHFFLGRCGTFSRFLSNQVNSKNSKSFWKKNDGAQNPEGFPSVFYR